MEQISILDDNKRIEINKRKKEVKFVAIDVETTGLSPVYNELIEISAIKYEGAKKIDNFSTLVKPKKEVSNIITNLTGITNKMLEKLLFELFCKKLTSKLALCATIYWNSRRWVP